MQADEYLFEGLEVAGGASAGFGLRVPHRGLIFRLVVAQTSGDLEGFTYTLFNDPQACPVGPIATPAAARDHLFVIAGPCIVDSGKGFYDGTGGSWAFNGSHCLYLPYMTRDFQGVAGSRPYELRLRIDAAGTGVKAFGAAMTLAQGEYV